MPAPDAGRLHPAVGGEVGRAEADSPCIRGLAPAISSTFATPRAVSRIAWTRIGRVSPALGLELGQQPVDVVDVLGALHLGHHDDVEPVADLGDQGREVVERPRGVERVDPRPELGVLAEVGAAGDVDQPGPGGLLAVGPHGVLEVAEQHVDGADHRRDLRRHPLVARVEEVDHPARAGRTSWTGAGAPTARGVKKSLALRMVAT